MPQNNKKIGDRIRKAREMASFSLDTLSDNIGISKRTLQDYEKNRQEPRITIVFDIAKICHVSDIWLLTGRDDMNNQCLENIKVKNDDLVNIPYYDDIRASAGTGIINHNLDVTIMQISMTFLREYFGIMQNAKVEIIKISGNSMEPTILPNQLIFVNRKEEYLVNGTIYIVRYYDDLLIKRVARNPKTKSIKLISDNKDYDDIIIEDDDLEHFEIVGRVLGNLNSL